MHLVVTTKLGLPRRARAGFLFTRTPQVVELAEGDPRLAALRGDADPENGGLVLKEISAEVAAKLLETRPEADATLPPEVAAEIVELRRKNEEQDREIAGLRTQLANALAEVDAVGGDFGADEGARPHKRGKRRE